MQREDTPFRLLLLSITVLSNSDLLSNTHFFNAVLGRVLFQSIYPSKILKLNFRERKENAWEDSGSDELSVVFRGVIARFDGADLQVCVKPSISLLETDRMMLSRQHRNDQAFFVRLFNNNNN